MDHIGIDVPKRESQIYILAEGGEVIEQRIRTESERFDAVLGSRPRARKPRPPEYWPDDIVALAEALVSARHDSSA